MDKKQKIKCINYCIIYTLRILTHSAISVFVIILFNYTKKNPFEIHIIGNLTSYFYNEVPITNEIKYNNTLHSSLSTGEFKLNISENTHSDMEIKKKLFLRILISESDCLEIRDKFERFRDTKLSNIFDLKYNKIHNISLAVMVIVFVIFFLSVEYISFIYMILEKKSIYFIYILSYFINILSIANFILSLILFYYIEKSDLEKYISFLDCKNVKVNFFKKILDVNKIRKCFYAFVILNMIDLGIEKLEKLVDCEEKIENLIGNENKNKVENVTNIKSNQNISEQFQSKTNILP